MEKGPKLIPGARERNTLTTATPGSVGGRGFGSAYLRPAESPMDVATILEHQKEGGGRTRRKQRHS